ncbi:MAG TPA: hypothetical protein VMS77_01810 [Conexivisphaerales archaeon]|nr:hypothetical protein [Conexivisphaerales archaeon]
MRRLAKSVHQEARYAKEKSSFLREVKRGTDLGATRGPILDLREKPKVGSKLIRAGAALVLSPEPFGDIPGGIMIASGLAMKKYGDATAIADIKPNIRKLLEGFERGCL